MIDHKREKFFDRTVAEWIETLPWELSIDAVGLWQIIPQGRRGFGLEGDDLIEFTRRGLLCLLQKGARPVRGAPGSPSGWVLAREYGDAPAGVAEAVIAEWLACGAGDPTVSDLWFATPNIYEPQPMP